MRVHHSIRNLIDTICFSGVLIVVPFALLLYHSAATIVDTSQYQNVVAAIHASAATNVTQGPAATPCADCARVAAVR